MYSKIAIYENNKDYKDAEKDTGIFGILPDQGHIVAHYIAYICKYAYPYPGA